MRSMTTSQGFDTSMYMIPFTKTCPGGRVVEDPGDDAMEGSGVVSHFTEKYETQ